MTVIPPSEVDFIHRAAKYLENPSFMVRIADLVGVPLEGLLDLVPPRTSQAVSIALRRGLDLAVLTLPKQSAMRSESFPEMQERVWWTGYRHTAATAFTGGTAGMFGTIALCFELPITTCIMLRSMTAIAREYGEDTHAIDVRLECLSLFGIGGPSVHDDRVDASYLGVRAAMNSLVKHAAKYIAHTPAQEVVTSIKNGTAPALVKLLGKISQQFELRVSEKLMAQAVPLVGAVGGATVNVLFTEHFNAVARYHFGIRHLETRWGKATVGALYQEAAERCRGPEHRTPSRTPDFGYRGDDQFAQQTGKPR